MYNYEEMKQEILAPENTRKTLGKVLEISKKFQQYDIWEMQHLLGCGDSWYNMAVVEYLAECGFIHKVKMEDDYTNTKLFKNIRL